MGTDFRSGDKNADHAVRVLVTNIVCSLFGTAEAEPFQSKLCLGQRGCSGAQFFG